LINKRSNYPYGIKHLFKGTFSNTIMYIASLILLIFLFNGCATTNNPESIRNAAAHNKIGSYYLSNDQFNEAFIEFQKSVKLDPNNKETLNYLGYISARYKKYDEAESYYKRAISVDPSYSDALNNLGVLYLDTKEWDNAIKYFQAALDNSVYSTPEKAYSGIGYAYYNKEDYVKAGDSFNKALIRNPVFPLAMYNLGLVYVKLKKYDDAVAEFKKAIGIIPNYMDAHWELALTYLLLDKKDKALKHLKAVAEESDNTIKRNMALEYIERLKY